MEWIEPWHLLDIEEQDIFNLELKKELSSEHELFSASLNAIAKSDASDDVLYVFTDGTSRVAEIHLTWTQRTEICPFPCATIYCNLDTWKNNTLYTDMLPLIDYSNSVCMMGYFLLGYWSYSDFFQWVECLIEQGSSFKEAEVLLSFSLNSEIEHDEFIICLNQVFKELQININDIEKCLSVFSVYLCDRVIKHPNQADEFLRIFNKLHDVYAEQFNFFNDWKMLSSDLYSIHTYHQPNHFHSLSLDNEKMFVNNFSIKFKQELMLANNDFQRTS